VNLLPVLLRKLLRDLWQRKLAVLTLVGILSVGIGCFTGPAALHRDLTQARDSYYRKQGLADLLVELKHAPQSSLERLRSLPNILALRDRIALPVLLDLPQVKEPITGLALSMPSGHPPNLHRAYLTSGSWFSHQDAPEVVLNQQFARIHGYHPGDRISLHLRGKQENLLVTGTALDPQFVWIVPPGGGIAPDPGRFGILYLPRRFLAERSHMEGAYNQLLVTLRDPSKATSQATLKLLETQLDSYGVTATSRMQENLSVKMLADEIDGLEVTTRTVPLIFLGVAALILHVVLGRLVTQQRTVIGTLKALGYRNRALFRHYLGFALGVGLLGGILGLLVGRAQEAATLPIYAEMFAMPEVTAHATPDLWLVGLVISALFACLGALQALRGAVRLDPAESMHPPPPEAGGKILPEALPWIWRALSFRTKLILRSIFRNPFRNCVNVVTTFAATSLILSTLCLTDSVSYLMDFHFNQIRHEDISVTLREPRGPEVLKEIHSLPGVEVVEGQLVVRTDVSRGSRKKRLAIQGLPSGASLHTPVDPQGHLLVIPNRGLVMSRKLAEILAVHPGDSLLLRPLIGRRKQVQVQVTAVLESYLGLSVYADARFLSRLLGEDIVFNQVLVKLQPGKNSEAFSLALKTRPGVIGLDPRRRALTQLQDSFGQVQLVSLGVLILFAGMIAFGSVLNIALVTLSERQQEVATFRVLGYRPRTLSLFLSMESLAVNGLGTFLGIFGGWGLTLALARAYDTELYRFPATLEWSRVLQTCFTMILFVGLAQGLVGRLIRRLDWIQALSVKE
jgi:putative ABC transport system permease protein